MKQGLVITLTDEELALTELAIWQHAQNLTGEPRQRAMALMKKIKDGIEARRP